MYGFIIVLVLALFFFFVGYLYGYLKEKRSAMKEDCVICITSNDTATAAKQIGLFLFHRDWVCRLHEWRYKGVKHEGICYPKAFYKGHAISVVYLVRLCHLLGCKVIVRQVGSGKDECEEQIISNMRGSFYKRNKSQIFDI